MSDHIGPIGNRMRVTNVVSDAWVNEAADTLIEKHGADAMTEAGRLLSIAVTGREQDRIFFMLRVQFAVAALQAAAALIER